MGVYIEGMEMPPACNRCWNCDINTVDGTETEPPYACLVRMKFVEEEWEHKRPEWCPLIEVPPHGDLIDRDAIPREAYRGDVYDLADALLVAPTIIEKEGET